jgi:type IV pilus assembly protein PilQ
MTQHQRTATMTTEKIQGTRRPLFYGLALGLMLCTELSAGTIEGLGFTPLPGGEVEVAIKLDGPSDPQIFATENPARIALDFADTTLSISQRALNVGTGATKMVTAVEAGNRSRVVVDLFRASNYTTRMEGKTLYIKIGNGFAGEAASAGRAASNVPAGVTLASAASALSVKSVDFRRGKSGEGRIIVDFTGDGASADLKTEGGKLIVDVYNAKVGTNVAGKLDVTDFATPVQSVDIKSRSAGTRIEIGATGEYDQLAYQAGNQFVVEVSPKRLTDDAKKKANEPPVYAGARATYNFQDIPVRSLLQLIADVSDFNVVVADSVQGNVTVRLMNVPWDQALDIVLQTKGLDKRRNGNVIYIAPTDEIAKREQSLEDARLALEDRQQLITDFIPISYGKAEDIAKLLTEDSLKSQGGGGGAGQQQQQGQQGFLSQRGSLSFDQRTNTLLIVDIPSKVASIRELVGRLDKPVQQVLIESRIVVASDNYSKELGVRFGLTGATEDRNGNVLSVGGSLEATDTMSNLALANRLNRNPSGLPVGAAATPGDGILVPALINRLGVNLPSSDPNAARFGFTVLGNDYLLDLELSALENEGRGEIISSPRVITASQREATIRQGTEIPYTVRSADPTTGAISFSVQFKPVVLELKVTPTISPDQRIFMNLEVKQDTVGNLLVQGNPSIDTRNINTAVLVDNGQTVVLGGILERENRDGKSQVPLLGDLPGVGNLFKRKTRRDQRSELLIFVTPKILQDSLR